MATIGAALGVIARKVQRGLDDIYREHQAKRSAAANLPRFELKE